ncbi:glutathione S-transferase C-terminal domain-containing protein-like [Mercenaria mercenaria]|uniref:glutathione S-transferase C-terminal domain-containing protein-like n=1 Tax=Mercenaria mercenaria TaxID=6596 RepID=UPI00234F8F0D|nr:glutathione S-transferase C-terminal domain-containing protein-like [Mercenaria mercenaria]
MQIYISGYQADESTVSVPLSSSVILFLLKYCKTQSFHVHLVDCQDEEHAVVSMSRDCLQDLHYSFIDRQSIPTKDGKDLMIRCGLCSVVRHIIKLCHELMSKGGDNTLIDLADTLPISVEIPEDVMKLELHFDRPPLLHNDDKKKRLLLKSVQNELENVESCPEDGKTVVRNFFTTRENTMPHGNIRYRVITQEEKEDKKFVNGENGDKCKFGCTENRLIKWCAKCNDREKLRRKEERQIQNNSRLIEKTNSDFVTEKQHNIVFFIYHLLESLRFRCSSFLQKLPNVKKWLTHILTLPRMQHTAVVCGFKMDALMESVKTLSVEEGEPEFTIPEVILDVEENTANISRSSKAKQRALKRDISRVLEKIKEHNINPVVGHHPYGDNVKVDWKSVPLSAHPKIELPEKRVGRKCEQLENLATAVQSIASPGHVIVDFCSGAGHLGIIIAYLLPDCQVFLVENNEESLVRASRRVNSLNLTNISLYQCNLDYFQGQFDIGVCLHACGVATDLVLQQCLDRKASFVICPCCYGSIQNTHLISYPRSQSYREAELNDKDVIVLGHAADQTEENTELQQQGRHCMNLVDTDRARLATENGYTVTLCSLKPLSCTPKNNILIGTRCMSGS